MRRSALSFHSPKLSRSVFRQQPGVGPGFHRGFFRDSIIVDPVAVVDGFPVALLDSAACSVPRFASLVFLTGYESGPVRFGMPSQHFPACLDNRERFAIPRIGAVRNVGQTRAESRPVETDHDAWGRCEVVERRTFVLPDPWRADQFAETRQLRPRERTPTTDALGVGAVVGGVIGRVEVDPRNDALQLVGAELDVVMAGPQHLHEFTGM